MKKFSTVLLTAIFALNISGQTIKRSSSGKVLTDRVQSESSQIVSDEEYKIYSVALKHLMSKRDDKEMPVIKIKTDVDKDSKDFNNLEMRGFGLTIEKIDHEARWDFLIKNEKSSTLENKFPNEINHIFITDEQLKKDFAYKVDGYMNWELFSEKYPKTDSIYTFSRAGFSRDGNKALIFVTFWCFSACGEGNYYIMKKENGEWRIVDRLMTWIS